MSCERDKNSISTRIMKMETVIEKVDRLTEKELVYIRMLAGEIAACTDCLCGHIVCCNEMELDEIERRLNK